MSWGTYYKHEGYLSHIGKHEIETQEELGELLRKAGYNVTQATISRDIRQLKLTKVTTHDGGQKYAMLGETPQPPSPQGKYKRVLSDGFVSMDTAHRILVIKTVAGMAMAVAAAIDELHPPGMVGCIAGDDTIMCAVKTGADTAHIVAMIKDIIRETR